MTSSLKYLVDPMTVSNDSTVGSINSEIETSSGPSRISLICVAERYSTLGCLKCEIPRLICSSFILTSVLYSSSLTTFLLSQNFFVPFLSISYRPRIVPL